MSHRSPALLALPVLLTLVLTGCTSSEATVARPDAVVTYTAGEVPVLVPGRPGEEARVLSPGESATRANPLAYEEGEVRFVTDMVPHHAQALVMAQLAPGRASSQQVLALASRIEADQGPEIATFQAWLEQNGLPKADEDGGHDGHAGMPGMADEAALARLVAAEGPAFDRLFLELMTAHHEGALAMAERAGTVANARVAEMVADTQAKQSVEIARMQQLLDQLPG